MASVAVLLVRSPDVIVTGTETPAEALSGIVQLI
jgi:hypothetical protein